MRSAMLVTLMCNITGAGLCVPEQQGHRRTRSHLSSCVARITNYVSIFLCWCHALLLYFEALCLPVVPVRCGTRGYMESLDRESIYPLVMVFGQPGLMTSNRGSAIWPCMSRLLKRHIIRSRSCTQQVVYSASACNSPQPSDVESRRAFYQLDRLEQTRALFSG